MRQLIAAPLFGLFLLGGCGQPEHLLSEPDAATPVGIPSPAIASSVPIRLASGFTPDDEARIVAAIGDVNRRGGVRLDLAPTTRSVNDPGAWTIRNRSGLEFAATDEWQVAPIAVIQRFPSGGGVIVVDLNRLGHRDLRSVMVRELEVAMIPGDSRIVSAAR